MEDWDGLVGWPVANTLPTKWSHVNHRSGTNSVLCVGWFNLFLSQYTCTCVCLRPRCTYVCCVLLSVRDDNHSGFNPFLLHQSQWQVDMLRRYGSAVCLIDATYNTTVYRLPLFMLCVLTNSGFIVVASFLTSDETSASIVAGLRILADRCPDWSPKFIMSDFSEAQISAAESLFPSEFFSLTQSHNYTELTFSQQCLHFLNHSFPFHVHG